jgi:predicted transcriptional regulator of viral defense system
MKYLELKSELRDFTIFSLNEIRNIEPGFHRRRLNEWQDKGYIKKVIRGYYIFSDLQLSEEILFKIANRIYLPSYISLESALSYYHLIPESVYGITSISTRKTYHFRTSIGEFIYRTLKPPLFFGYDLIKFQEKYLKMASIEKALLDYFYLHSDIETEQDFDSLRINKEMFFEQMDEKKLMNFLEKFNQKKLAGRINRFWSYIKNA